jgi:hypothetical protein
MGNPLSDFGLVDSGKVQVDHTILVSTALDMAICRALNALSDATKETSKTLNIVGCAAACYFVLLGISKVVDASRSNKKQQ